MCKKKHENLTGFEAVKKYVLQDPETDPLQKLRHFPAWALAEMLQSGQCQFVFHRQEMGLEALTWRNWQIERPYHIAQFKRQTACPGDFARMYLSLEPCDSELFELSVTPPGQPDSSISIPGSAPDTRQNLFLLPGWLLGFIDALRKQQIWGLRLNIHELWVHEIDSQPRSFYLCARQCINGLLQQNQSF